MTNQINALMIEIRKPKSKSKKFEFNETMLHAIQSGLSVTYAESFIWSLDDRLIVVVSNENTDILVQTFIHHKDKYKTMKILQGEDAMHVLEEVASGNIWSDCSIVQKLQRFDNGYRLSKSLECIGENLDELLKSCSGILNNQEVVKGARNSWKSSTLNETEPQYDGTNTNLFYRFCIN